MRKVVLVCSMMVLTLFSIACNAQPAKPPQPAAQKPQEQVPPGTALEAFLGKKGKIIVKEFYEGGRVSGMGNVEMKSMLISEPGSLQKIKGLRIEVTESSRVERSSTSFIDFDELESLGQALDYMTNVASKFGPDHQPYTEVIYTSKGDFKVGFFQNGKDVSAFVESGRVGSTTAFVKIDDLATMRKFVNVAMMTLRGK